MLLPSFHNFVDLTLLQKDSDQEDGGEGPVTSQPTSNSAPPNNSANPIFAMPPPPSAATESTSLNPQEHISYTPGSMCSSHSSPINGSVA